jgi:glycerol-3-phosphate dehydrogenase
MSMSPAAYDLLVIGGGVNGAGIARDAAGRGLAVLLAERGDLAAATSSASSKLIHGGLRYLEQYAFRLVREALAERDILLRNAPHIIWPVGFVLPIGPGSRPAWMLRLGLFLYDSLGWTPGAPPSPLPRSRRVDLSASGEGRILKPEYGRGYLYSDCWVDDARLVVLNAVDAATRGARIATRTQVLRCERGDGGWRATLAPADGGTTETVVARAVVNAAGPWAGEVLGASLGINAAASLRLVKGSHIVVPRLYDAPHALILQNDDRRVVFVIPYERDFTLIGTTDVAIGGTPGPVSIDPSEVEYLCRAVNRYTASPVRPADIVWSYSGVRPLYDDGASDASSVTRDYVLDLNAPPGLPPALSVFGGKITTYRRLAEHALEKLAPFLPGMAPAWTARCALPGGDIPGADFDAFLADLRARLPWMDAAHLHGLARRHGTRAADVVGDARSPADLGRHFGAGLYAREIDWLRREEWARTADDVLWRRTKTGLHLDAAGRREVMESFAR